MSDDVRGKKEGEMGSKSGKTRAIGRQGYRKHSWLD